jgi:myo-inositol-1(or 4)-monophosphatase
VTRFLDVAIEAARAGAAELRAARRGDLEIEYKDTRANLVTVADRRSQRAITGVILHAFPGHRVDGEEGAAGDPESGHVWYVDPLDGTTNYSHGIPFYCVSVALRAPGGAGGAGGQTIAGVVYDPVRDELFAAERSHGATLNGSPLRVSATGRLARALVVAQAQSDDPGQIRKYARLVERLMLTAGGVRSLGSPALTLCAIAAGRLDAYCEYAMDSWDTAAGQLIVEESGGTLTTFGGDQHVTAERIDVAASNGAVHAELIDALKGLA